MRELFFTLGLQIYFFYLKNLELPILFQIIVLVDKVLQVIVNGLLCQILIESEDSILQFFLRKIQNILKLEQVHRVVLLRREINIGLKPRFHDAELHLVQHFLQCPLRDKVDFIYLTERLSRSVHLLIWRHRFQVSPNVVRKVHFTVLDYQNSFRGVIADLFEFRAIVMDDHENSFFDVSHRF